MILCQGVGIRCVPGGGVVVMDGVGRSIWELSETVGEMYTHSGSGWTQR